ncbi:MAG: hypothetical protein WA876_10570 [Candidatus Acidiferrales bacterium]
MPFINGRFYANPVYGNAVENARDTDNQFNGEAMRSDVGDGDDVPEIEPMSDSVQQPGVSEQRSGHKRNQTASKSPDQVTNSIYNETSGLRSITKRGPGSANDLSNARAYMASIARFGKASVASDKLSPSETHAIKTYPPARAAYEDSQRAAHVAFTGPDPGGATHFYLDDGRTPPAWAKGKKPAAVFGPFKNEAGGGDIRKGAIVRIVIIR